MGSVKEGSEGEEFRDSAMEEAEGEGETCRSDLVCRRE